MLTLQNDCIVIDDSEEDTVILISDMPATDAVLQNDVEAAEASHAMAQPALDTSADLFAEWEEFLNPFQNAQELISRETYIHLICTQPNSSALRKSYNEKYKTNLQPEPKSVADMESEEERVTYINSQEYQNRFFVTQIPDTPPAPKKTKQSLRRRPAAEHAVAQPVLDTSADMFAESEDFVTQIPDTPPAPKKTKQSLRRRPATTDKDVE